MVYYYGKKSGDVLKWFKRPHSKCDRPVIRCEGSNPSISAKRHTPSSDGVLSFLSERQGFGPGRARASVRKSGGLSSSERSEGDRAGSQGRSLQAERCRRSNPSTSFYFSNLTRYSVVSSSKTLSDVIWNP